MNTSSTEVLHHQINPHDQLNQRLQSHCAATIVAIDGANVALDVERRQCDHCGSFCLMRMLGTAEKKPVVLPRVHFSSSVSYLQAGKRVKVSISTGLLLGLSAAVYLVPVIVMLLFAITFSFAVTDSELMVFSATVVGLILGLVGSNLLVRLFETKAKRSLQCSLIEH